MLAVAMCVAVVVLDGVGLMTAATRADDVAVRHVPAETVSPTVTPDAPAQRGLPFTTIPIVRKLAAMPATPMLFAIGMVLIGLAAGLRRRR